MGHNKLVTDDQSKYYPDFLKSINKTSNMSIDSVHPLLISPDDKNFKQIIESKRISVVIDNYAEQFAELILSRNAHLYRANHSVQVASIKQLLSKHYASNDPWQLGKWVFFPWNGQLVHILDQEDFEELRTIRNRELITKDEQAKLFSFRVACFGMSVGSASALSLAMSGISRNIKLIDGAVISGSNLNRIITGISSVGLPKSTVIGQKVYEMNPYTKVEYFNKVTLDNINDIFDEPWPIELAIDEIDDIKMKVAIRIEARNKKIPVVMATELGDTVMIDVERFDLEPNRPLFHNLIPDIEDISKKNLDNYREWTKHAVNIIDPSNMPLKMQQSVMKIGTTIVTHPQLGSTVMITGGVVSFVVKNILNNQLKSGRYIISLEKELLASHNKFSYKRNQKKHTKIIKEAINSM